MLTEMGNKNPAAVLEGLIALQVLGGIAFIICSFVVAHTENVGFNVVLSGILNLVFAVASYYYKELKPIEYNDNNNEQLPK